MDNLRAKFKREHKSRNKLWEELFKSAKGKVLREINEKIRNGDKKIWKLVKSYEYWTREINSLTS